MCVHYSQFVNHQNVFQNISISFLELHVVLESLLIGHEGWVYGVSWSMQEPGEGEILF